MSTAVDQNVLLDDELIEKGFNEALDDLQKSLNPELSKAESKVTDEDEEEAEEEEEDEGKDEDMKDYKKSIEDLMSEEPEAAMAMDVEPYLLQIVKAIGESFNEVMAEVATVRKLAKSIGQMTAVNAQLQKSMSDTIKAIGGQPMPTKGAQSFGKSRFGGEDNPVEVDNTNVLLKSREWVQKGKINLEQAGMIEGRINSGKLGSKGDPLDNLVADLMKEKD